MKRFTSVLSTLAAFATFAFAAPAFSAEPEYVTIEMEIDINKPAAEVWAKVGGYCDISKWIPNFTCEITSGDGGMGSVRTLTLGNGAKILEINVAQTELSYGYTQPVVEGRFYNLYHGFMEARPVTATTSKMLYTLVYDVSNLATKEEKDADMARRRTTFETALATIKTMAEE